MWVDKLKNTQSITEGSKINVYFQWSGEEPQIEKMTSSCGCSKPVWESEHNRIKVSFKAPEVPKHLRYKGYYTPTKTITVVRMENLQPVTDTLKFTTTIKVKP